jgi:hypothetical protein
MKKINYLILSCILFFESSINGQLIFEKTYEDLPNYFFGWRLLNTLSGGTTYTLGVNKHINLLKINDSGNVLWSKKFTRNNFKNFGHDLILNNSNLLIVGQSTDTIDTVNLANNFKDLFLLNVDTTSGTIVISKTYGDTLDSYLLKVIKTSDNNFIGVGVTNAEPNPPYGAGSALIVKFDSLLNIVWSKKYTDSHVCQFNSIIESSNGFLYLTGVRNKVAEIGYDDAIILKTDASGNIVWSKTLDNGFSENSLSIILINNSIFIAGDYGDILNATFYSSFIAKIDTNGNLNWFKKYYTNYNLSGTRLFFKNDNEYFLLASKFLCKIDSTGAIISGFKYNQDLTDLGFTTDGGFIFSSPSGNGIKISKTDSNALTCLTTIPIILDSTISNVTDSVIFFQQSSQILISKPGLYEKQNNLNTNTICYSATSIQEILENSNTSFTAMFSPNPFSTYLEIHLPSATRPTIKLNVKIFNLWGHTIFEQNYSKIYDNKICLNTGFIDKGLYYISIKGAINFYSLIIKN